MRRKLLKLLKSNKLGSLSVMAFLFLGTGLFVKHSGYTMPGPVSAMQYRSEPIEGFASHAMFEQECTHCHAPIHCVTAEKCQDCHVEIAEQRVEAVGLHGLLPGTERCQNCHVEHQGRDAVISEIAFANVDHEAMTGFSLEKHSTNYDGQPMTCESCHTEGRYGADTVDCLTCHTENDRELMTFNNEEYGLDCLGCHDGRDRMIDFDHNQVYGLDGEHAQASCVDCHGDMVFAGKTQACADCHEVETEHTDVFGFDCARCHTAVAWTPAQLTQHTFLLEHGDQDKLECQNCHPTTYYKPTCVECHEDGQMIADHEVATIVGIENCATCHPTGATGEAEQLGYTLDNLDIKQD
jgi:hypothetical protein